VSGTSNPQFQSAFGTFTDLSGLINVDELVEIVPSMAPAVTTKVWVERGLTWLCIQNIGVKHTGIVMGYAIPVFMDGVMALNSSEPEPFQIKYLTNCLNQSLDTSLIFIIPFLDAAYVYSIYSIIGTKL
jgi:hypothetical protein